MRKFVGVAVIVVGVVLVMTGLDASDSLGSRLSRLFTGSPTDRTVWYLVGGTCALMAGVWLACSPRNNRS